MSPWSKIRQSRNQWQHKATQRADQDRYWRPQLSRVTTARDRVPPALKATQARLRQLASQSQGLALRHKVDLGLLALHLVLGARLGFRAVSRILSLLALALGIKKAPCPQTIINWVTRLSLVRIPSARRLKGVALSPAPFAHGLIGLIDISIARGPGKSVALLALAAPHPQLPAAAPGLQQGRCLAVAVAASWTGDTLAELLRRLIAVLGRPAAHLTDGGSELQQAIGLLEEQGLARPSIDALSHAGAHMLKRRYQAHPKFSTFVSACGRVSGKLKQTIRACLAPPTRHTKARFMKVHRLVTWADRLLNLSPAGGAKAGSTLANLRACLALFPSCKAFITRFRDEAVPLLACQKILQTQGLSHATLAQCAPLIAAIPSLPGRREFAGYLQSQLQTATRLGLDDGGLPISSAPIEALCGLATPHGGGARARMPIAARCACPPCAAHPPGRKPSRGLSSAPLSRRRAQVASPL
jgi:hypothetical protein